MPHTAARSPLVSVVMPVYNGAEYLAESIQSIVSQTFTDFEFIIVEDHSCDSSAKIIKEFAAKDSRIKVISNETNQGQSPSANIGFRASKGLYVARMDQDDIALPERLEKQVAFLDKHPEHLLVGTQVEIINKQGKVVGVKKFPTSHKDILEMFSRFLPLCHPTIMVRKSLLDTQDRLWFEEGDPIPDTYTFLYYVTKRKMANLPEVLLQYRVHEDNGSYQNIKAIFTQTIKYRIHAIKHWNFPFKWYYPLIWFVQAVPVYLLPNKWVMELFLFSRGHKNLLTSA